MTSRSHPEAIFPARRTDPRPAYSDHYLAQLHRKILQREKGHFFVCVPIQIADTALPRPLLSTMEDGI